jgi:ATP:ADP antiporter, AAA family
MITLTLPAAAPAPRAAGRILSRVLRPFATVQPHEAVSTVLLALAVFTLLMSYYLLKTAREPLILLHGGAELKSYASAGQALLLLAVIPAYAALARRVGRLRLLLSVYAFFLCNLLAFLFARSHGIEIGLAFYVWVGVFNQVAVAQLWSFANDVYTPEQGQRLFAILGTGSALGAVVGAFVAKPIASLSVESLLLAAAMILIVSMALIGYVDQRQQREPRANAQATQAPPVQGIDSALWQLLRDKFLLWIAALTLLLNFVNSNGEYLLDRSLLSMLAGQDGTASARAVAAFKADYFGWVNVVGLGLQMFCVSRVLGRIGVRGSLYVMPIIVGLGYASLLFMPGLALMRFSKITENGLNYSLQNTARQAVFLVGTRSEKFLGKTVIDSFVVRLGDLCSAALVFVSSCLGLSNQAFAWLNLALIGLWLVVLVGLGREHARRAQSLAAEST